MRVFRIENESGLGICTSGTGLCKTYQSVCGISCHGTCFGDKENDAALNVTLLGWKFGFSSLQQAKEWFPEEAGRRLMQEHGAKLVEYETSETLPDAGDHQVIFPIESATKIAEHDLVKLEQ